MDNTDDNPIVITNGDGSKSLQIPSFATYSLADLQAQLSFDQGILDGLNGQVNDAKAKVDRDNALISLISN